MSSPTAIILTIPFHERYRGADQQPITILNRALKASYQDTDGKRGLLSPIEIPGPNGLEECVYGCVFDYLNLPLLLDELTKIKWFCPEGVHLLVEAEWCHHYFHHTSMDMLLAFGWETWYNSITVSTT